MKNKLMSEKVLGLLFMMPSALVISLFVVYPIYESVLLSFRDINDSSFTTGNYRHFFTNENSINNIKYTMNIVIWTVVLTLIFSLLLSLFIRFSKSPSVKYIKKLIIIPKFIPGIIAVYAFMTVIKNNGAMTKAAYEFAGKEFRPDILHTAKGIILMNLWFNVPFSTLLISSSLGKVKDSVIESARDIGASKFLILFKVIIPMISKTLLLSLTFVFMGNLGSFTTPFLMGTNSVRMLGVALFNEFSVYNNLNMAATLSVVLFMLSSLVGGFYIYSMLKEEKLG